MARVMQETCPGIRDKIVIVYNGVDIAQIDRVCHLREMACLKNFFKPDLRWVLIDDNELAT